MKKQKLKINKTDRTSSPYGIEEIDFDSSFYNSDEKMSFLYNLLCLKKHYDKAGNKNEKTLNSIIVENLIHNVDCEKIKKGIKLAYYNVYNQIIEDNFFNKKNKYFFKGIEQVCFEDSKYKANFVYSFTIKEILEIGVSKFILNNKYKIRQNPYDNYWEKS